MKIIEINTPEASPCQLSLYEPIFENNPKALFIIDDQMNILSINKAFKQLLQNSKKQGLSNEAPLPASLPELLHYLEPGSNSQELMPIPHQYVMEVSIKNNYTLHLQTSFAASPMQSQQSKADNNPQTPSAILTTLAYENGLQSDLASLENLKSTSELAASISHEIRNPMTSVRGFLQFLSTKPEFSEHKNDLDLVIEELDCVNSILNEYLFLSRNKPCKPKKENLNLLLQKLFPLLKTSVSNSNQTITLELGKIPTFLLNGKEIRQLIFNLVRNGLEAMPNGGELKLQTYLSDEQTVTLAVSDQGAGIAAEDLPKITSPFFTTKENGTGIGLAVCSQIAHKHNAVMEVASSPNGTTFFIHFKQIQL